MKTQKQSQVLRTAAFAYGVLAVLLLTPNTFGQNGGNASVVTDVPYYRVFQGVKLPEISRDAFLKTLGGIFIPALPRDIGPHGAIAYLPTVPPQNTPAGIPDEFALIAYESRKAYDESRATPEGKAYGELHWTLFDREKSLRGEAAPLGDSISVNTPYDVSQKQVDWQSGHSTFFVGLKKNEVNTQTFLDKLHQHVKEIQQAFGNFGMDGYIIVTNGQYEAAYQHWPSKEAAAAAFQSQLPAVQNAFKTAGEIFNLPPLQFSEAVPFEGTIQLGQLVNVQFQKRQPLR